MWLRISAIQWSFDYNSSFELISLRTIYSVPSGYPPKVLVFDARYVFTDSGSKVRYPYQLKCNSFNIFVYLPSYGTIDKDVIYRPDSSDHLCLSLLDVSIRLKFADRSFCNASHQLLNSLPILRSFAPYTYTHARTHTQTHINTHITSLQHIQHFFSFQVSESQILLILCI